jgi:hypothetical protein
MLTWKVHVIGYLPPARGATNVAEAPAWIVGVVKLPSAAVRVCITESLLRTVTVAPDGTVSAPW